MVRLASPRAVELIMESEGFRAHAYQDATGIWTIGYGHTGPHVKGGQWLTEGQGRQLLETDLLQIETYLTNCGLDLNDNEFSALCCFIYNVGIRAFSHSTMYKFLDRGDWPAAIGEFHKWSYAGHVVLPGLEKRRDRERQLFTTGSYV